MPKKNSLTPPSGNLRTLLSSGEWNLPGCWEGLYLRFETGRFIDENNK